jgi:hypothetical protein
MFVNSDWTDLLRLLESRNVRYLVIGGYAVTQYAEPRFTKDLDLWAWFIYREAKPLQFGRPFLDPPVTDRLRAADTIC